VREKHKTFFRQNLNTLSPPSQKPDKLSKNTKFSDVIAIEGYQGHLQAVSLKNRPEICVKKSDPQNAAKLQDQIAIKRVVLEK